MTEITCGGQIALAVGFYLACTYSIGIRQARKWYDSGKIPREDATGYWILSPILVPVSFCVRMVEKLAKKANHAILGEGERWKKR